MSSPRREPSPRSAWTFTTAISVAVVAATVAAVVALPSFDDAEQRGILRSLHALAAEEAVLADLHRTGEVSEPFFNAESENIADQRKDLKEAER